MKITLIVIEPAAVGERHVMTEDGPDQALVWDHGDTDLLCGSCGFTLAASVLGPQMLSGYVLECPDCAALNAPG